EQLLAREQAARSQAEEASRLKDDFLATVSHELRTPLNSILGWARMLRSGKLDAQAAARAIETIERNARSQAGIIEDILDVSRIITGRLRLDFQTVDLQPVIEAAVDSVRPAAESRGVLIEQRLDAAVSHVSGDPQRIQQVIWNLLSNAIKFTPRGGRVRIALERINSHIEITVSDTGVGIRSEFLPYVFDRFRQADSSSTRMHGGLGLGLAIVRHLVELHGGAVSAESGGEGQGATFRVRLPLVAVRGETEGPGRRPPAALSKGGLGLSSDLKGVRVLVVDDEADARDLLSVVLAQSGAEVKAAASAAEALTAIEQWRPHVLVSDIGMPVEDGHALIRRLRALGPERGGLTPAVALTAYARSEDRLRALSAGYQMHVAKPVDPEELAAVIASLAGRLVRDRATE
ncbi:MAG TPA: ATP-binding protein, partial [Blastocatellia bacterium]|nr:ATP-binding protein [Blastocatellia bacterium]